MCVGGGACKSTTRSDVFFTLSVIPMKCPNTPCGDRRVDQTRFCGAQHLALVECGDVRKKETVMQETVVQATAVKERNGGARNGDLRNGDARNGDARNGDARNGDLKNGDVHVRDRP